MSSPTAHGPITSDESGGEPADASSREPSLLQPVRAAAFWAAVGLPFLYLPLVLGGPGTAASWQTVLALVALHAVALYVGRSHHQ